MKCALESLNRWEPVMEFCVTETNIIGVYPNANQALQPSSTILSLYTSHVTLHSSPFFDIPLVLNSLYYSIRAVLSEFLKNKQHKHLYFRQQLPAIFQLKMLNN